MPAPLVALTWLELIPLIIKEGAEFAAYLHKLSLEKSAPAPADWDPLIALSRQNSVSRAIDAISRAGLSQDNPKAAELLALVTPKS